MGSSSKLAFLAEGLLLAALVLAPWPYGCAPDWARYALCAVVGLALLIWSVGRAWNREALPPLLRPALGLPALALAQVVFARSVAPVWTAEALLLLLALLGASVFWSERARDHGAGLRLAAAVLVTCGAQALFGAFQWSQGPSRLYGQVTEIVTTPFGSYVNHNHFAGLIDLGLLVTAGLTLGHARRRGLTPASIALGGLTLGLGATLLASRSRGGLLALVAGLALLAWLDQATAHRQRTSRRSLVPLLALCVLGFGLVVVPGPTRAHLLTALVGGGDTSSTYRRDVAADTLRLVLSRPLVGSGLGAFADAFPPFKRGHGEVRTTHAEADILELLAEGGLAGALAGAWLLWYVGRSAWERLSTAHSGVRKGMALGSFAALGALGVHSLFDFNLRLPANAFLAATLLGLIAVPGSPPAALRSRWPSSMFALGCALLTLAAGWRALGARAFERALVHPQPLLRLVALDETLRWHPYLDQAWQQRGVLQRALAAPASDLRESRLRGAEHDLTRALRLRPQCGEAWAELGWTRLLRGNPAGARAAAARAQALDPTHAGIAFTRAHVLGWSGDVVGAVDEFTRLVAQQPGWWTKALTDALTFTRDPALLARLTTGDAAHASSLAAALKDLPRP